MTTLQVITVVPDQMDALTRRFLDAQDIKASSKETYRKGLRCFAQWIDREKIQNPAREDILAYKRYLGERAMSSLTTSSYMVAVRRFFEWCESIQLYPNIARNIKGAKKSMQFRKEPLTIAQVRELLGCVECSSVRGKRDFALINLLLRTGLRCHELVNIDIEDIRQQSGEALLYIHGKGRDSKDEFVLLTQEALKPLYIYLGTRVEPKGREPLFSSLSTRNRNQRLTTRSVRRIVKAYLKTIGINSGRITAHSLRHTFATVALMNGAPILQVKEAMRHKSIETTTIYAHAVDRISNGAERYVKF